MRNLKKWAAWLLCVLFLVTGLAACGTAELVDTAPEESPVAGEQVTGPEAEPVLPVDLKPIAIHEVTRSVFYAPQYVACSLGFFADEGLDVSITTSGGPYLNRYSS